MKLELGGGTRSCGDGFVNMDLCETADIRHDMTCRPWPLADDSVDAVYSCHCLEHLDGALPTLHEICRVCKVGAQVEIRVPFPTSDMAMCYGHRHVFSPMEAENLDQHFAVETWSGHAKRLKLERIDLKPSGLLERAKKELPFLAGLSDDIIMRWVPRTCHESRFFYTVVDNAT